MSASSRKLVVDVEFIRPFVVATKAVLDTMARTKLTVGKAYLISASESVQSDIAGVIDLSSPEFHGFISICFKAPVFLKVYELLVGERHEVITDQIQDAAGELVNIIYGQAKTELNEKKGYNLSSKLPLIFVGDKIGSQQLVRTPAIVLPFDSDIGSFHIEIVVDRV